MKKNEQRLALIGATLVSVVWLAAIVLLIIGTPETLIEMPTQAVLPPSSSDLHINRQPLPTATQPTSSITDPQIIPSLPPPSSSEVVIRFNQASTAQERAAYVESIDGTVTREIQGLDTVVVTRPEGFSVEPLPPSPVVLVTEPDYYVTVALSAPTSDPFYVQQWALPAMNVPEAWSDLPADVSSITVAVIDSGVCIDHPELVGMLLNGWDFVERDAIPQDEYGHGCGVAGIISALPDNGIGIAGIAPHVRLLPLRVLDANGLGRYSDVANAIVYATDQGAQIINISLGGYNSSSILEAAVRYAVDRGVLVVAAAGNTGTSTILYPAVYEGVVAVGSVGTGLQTSSFSSTGNGIDLWAPGETIISLSGDSGYALVNGTSFAAPHVVGVAALEMAYGRTLTINRGVVAFGGSSPAQEDTPVPEDEPQVVPSEYVPLYDRVRNNGRVSLIVGLNVFFQPEGDLSGQSVQAQRQAIAQAQQSVISALSAFDVDILNTYSFVPFMAVTVDEAGFLYLINSPFVTHIEENAQHYLTLGGSTDYINVSTAVTGAWAQGYDGTGWTVAVLDSGVEATHSFFGGRVISEACYSTSIPTDSVNSGGLIYDERYDSLCPGGVATSTAVGSSSPAACTGFGVDLSSCSHGTHVSGIAAGNGTSFDGVARSADIIGVQVFSRVLITSNHADTCTFFGLGSPPCTLNDITAFTSDIIAGMERVYELHTQGTNIAAVNMSLGGGIYSNDCDIIDVGGMLYQTAYKSAIDTLKSVGIATVISSGNDGERNAASSPGCVSTAITVGATGTTGSLNGESDIVASFSNISPIVDLLAPGTWIESAYIGNTFASFNGTSQAAPHVTGTWAIMQQRYPNATVDEILNLLETNGVAVFDQRTGGVHTIPRIDVGEALSNGTPATPTTGIVVISELNVRQATTTTPRPIAEFHNKGASPVDMTGWHFTALSEAYGFEAAFVFPSFTLNAGARVVLHPGNGTNTADTLYANDGLNTPSWYWWHTEYGAAALTNGVVGIDYVQWGNAPWSPPQGTNWFLPNAPQTVFPSYYLARDPVSTDTDSGLDWVIVSSHTFGSVNSGALPIPNNGSVNIVESTFDAGDTINIQVQDNDRYTNESGVTDTVTVTVVNLATSESEDVVLTETGGNTGTFNGTLNTTNATVGTNNDGVLHVQSSQTVQVTYLDVGTSTGFSANRTDTATAIVQFCNSVVDVSSSECEALSIFYANTNGASWTDDTGWLVNTSVCSWFGITCDGGNSTVTEIDLSNNNLIGSLPEAIANLPNLTVFDASNNQLTGSIPNAFGSLASFVELNLADNNLSSGIPVSLTNSSTLTSVILSDNPLGSGIPTEFGTGNIHNSLEVLELDNNSLTGAIPSSLGSISNLTILSLSNNSLNGTIPSSLGNLPNIEEIDLSFNQLTGEIPASFGNLDTVTILILANNQLDGVLPSELGDMTGLESFHIQNNAFVGEFPSSITSLTLLGTVDNLSGDEVDLGYNGLYSSNGGVVSFLNSRDADWANTQTMPPTNVTAHTPTQDSIQLSWTPILYTGDTGYYQVSYATAPGGPYTVYDTTADKSATGMTVSELTSNTTYYFVVQAYTAAHGSQVNNILSDYSDEVTETTVTLTGNDDFADAIVINSLPYIDTINNQDASLEVGEQLPGCGYNTGRSVWYSYTPGTNQTLWIDTGGSNVDTVLAVWTGSTLGSLTPVICDDNGGISRTSFLQTNVTSGVTYYIAISTNSGAAGSVTLNVELAVQPTVTPLPTDTPTATDVPDDTTSLIGLYNSGVWWMRNSVSSGFPDMYFTFGQGAINWQPVVGDWDGDLQQVDTIGLYHEGRVVLRNTNAGGFLDIAFNFGPQERGWLPIAGDWDGDGIDTIGLYQQGVFMLARSNANGAQVNQFNFGPQQGGWQPVAGDWNNDGIDTVGLYYNGEFLLTDFNRTGSPQYAFVLPQVTGTWQPVAGDWNRDGFDTVGLYAQGQWLLYNSNAAGQPASILSFGPANAGWHPLAGRWDGALPLGTVISSPFQPISPPTLTVPPTSTTIPTSTAIPPTETPVSASATPIPTETRTATQTVTPTAIHIATQTPTVLPETHPPENTEEP